MSCLFEESWDNTEPQLVAGGEREFSNSFIGKSAKHITRRRMYNGKVSKDAARNDFISVGKSEEVGAEAVHQVYGEGLCEAALCSAKPGDWRCQCCDQKSDKRHRRAGVEAHALPARSGPNHTSSWKRVLELTDKIRAKRHKRK